MSSAATPSPPPPPPHAVLRAFLARSCDRPSDGGDHFAANAVLEWFGRTIRGQARIQQFFRYDVHDQYAQNFGRPVASDAFETKPAHLQTRILPPAPQPPSRNAGDSDSDDLSVTPVSRVRIAPAATPSAPAQGRIFVRSRSPSCEASWSDAELADDLCAVVVAEPLTTPPRGGVELADRRPGRRKPIAVQREIRREAANAAGTEASVGSASACAPYSALHYLEACGTVRHQHSAKHHQRGGGGGGSASTQPTEATTTNGCNHTSNSSSGGGGGGSPLPYATDAGGHWERDVRLRISYRIRTDDNVGHRNAVDAVQFALIVYEPQTRNPRTRRNLMADFAQTDAASTTQLHPDAVPMQQQQTPPREEPEATQSAHAARRVPATERPKGSGRVAGCSARKRTAVSTEKQAGKREAAAAASSSSAFKSSLKRLRF